MTTPRVAIIGAGYAGLAAGVELAHAGVRCEVFESSRMLGGRARGLEKEGFALDNGQHLLLGAYNETLSLLRFLGVRPKSLLRRNFVLHVPERLHLAAAALPAPWHLGLGLLRARGLSWSDRLAMARLMHFLRRRRYTLHTDYPVSELLDRTRQTPLLIELIWEPLCLAALNTPLHAASAQVFAYVLRDSVGAHAAASELLIPRCDLSELLPNPAADYLRRQGCPVHTGRPVKQLRQHGQGFELSADGTLEKFSHVIIATAPYHAGALLAEFPALAQLRGQIDALHHEAITTIYLGYDEEVRLPEPMIELSGSIVQWMFDRQAIAGQRGVLAGVISASGEHAHLSREDFALHMHRAVEERFPHRRLRAPRWSQVITERRATFACTPGLSRPLTHTAVPGLLLAGDYVDSPYPATLEAAVRSGLAAAHEILRRSGAAKPAL